MHDGEALPLSVAIGVGMIDARDTAEAVMARADEEDVPAEGGGLGFSPNNSAGRPRGRRASS